MLCRLRRLWRTRLILRRSGKSSVFRAKSVTVQMVADLYDEVEDIDEFAIVNSVIGVCDANPVEGLGLQKFG